MWLLNMPAARKASFFFDRQAVSAQTPEPVLALLYLIDQRASRSFCRALAGFQSSGTRPSLMAAFSASVLRYLGAGTTVASMICPPMARYPRSLSAASKRANNSIAVANARAAGGQFILGMQAKPGNPYDGHALSDQLAQVERLTGIQVQRAYVDRGYKGHGHSGPAAVYISHTRGITSPTIKRELRRRNAIEAVIGHTKSDGLLERNYLKGSDGDAINAILVAAGHNMRLLLAWFAALFRAIFSHWAMPSAVPAR